MRATGRLIHRGRTTGTAEGDIRDAPATCSRTAPRRA
jgi:acyl-coenzyme A thioesterase PaaI-like protein